MQHKYFSGPAPCRQAALPSHLPALINFREKKKNSCTTSFLTNFVQRLQVFLVHFKALLAVHNWTFFPAQHRHYLRDYYPSWPYYFLPLATTSYPSPFRSYPTCLSGSAPYLPLLTFSKASLRATICSPHPKKPSSLLAPTYSQQKTLCPPQVTSPRQAPRTGTLPMFLAPKREALLLLWESASQLATGSCHRWKPTHFMSYNQKNHPLDVKYIEPRPATDFTNSDIWSQQATVHWPPWSSMQFLLISPTFWESFFPP